MTCAQLRQDWQKLKEVSREIKERKLKGENTMKEKKKLKVTLPVFIMNSKIDRFHMTSRRPYWCSKQIMWELDSFLMEKIFFVLINLGLSIRAFRETGPWSVAELSGEPKCTMTSC